jgi:hypothetical protein
VNYNNVYPFTKEELEKLGVNFKLWELCKYQQSIIDTYKEYIEKYIHQKIHEEVTKQPDFDSTQYIYCKHITIPEARLITRCDSWVHKNWEILQAENPVITPEYFISLAYREMEEKKNVETD